MFKTDVTYTNFLDQEVTETLRFNLREDELLDLVAEDPTFDSGFLAYISQEKDYQKMLKVVRKLVILSYGEVSEDGRSFRKSDEKALDFLQSPAYTAFMEKLFASEDGSAFANFIMQVVPSRYSNELKKRISEAGVNTTTVKTLPAAK